MKRKIFKKPQAEQDLIEHFAFIGQDKLKPAMRFLDVVRESFERLAAMPTIGRVWESDLPHLCGTRVYVMPSPYRNYLIFYRFTDEVLDILTVLHGARDLEIVLRSTTDPKPRGV